jgi:hypothetical protein
VRKATQAGGGRSGGGGSGSSAEIVVVSEVMTLAGARVELQQRANGAGKIVIEFEDGQARDAVLMRLRNPDG